uniref:Reverse transcriptase domain-containing protein n=1 Tax=Trichuris muris TaxID=70415 RepID=A0A5S6R594_TRIMR
MLMDLERQVRLSVVYRTRTERERLERKLNRLICSQSWEFFRKERSSNRRDSNNPDLKRVVVNLSSKTLSLEEEKVLAKGLNFVPTPTRIEYLDLISKLENGINKDDRLTGDTFRSLLACYITRHKYRPIMNLTREENRIIKVLREKEDILITRADKGNVVVILDKETYNDKVKELLNTSTYKPLKKDPSDKVRKNLNAMLSRIYEETKEERLSWIIKKLKYTTNFSCPELFCLPKIHKEGVPLRPVVACNQSVVRELCSFLAEMLKPITGLRSSHTDNSVAFVQEVRRMELQEDDILVSYDVKDLFTSVPLDYTYDIILDSLSKDENLQHRSKLNPHHLTRLVRFCMEEGNYFQWNGSYFSQKKGAPMGSPLSPIVAEIFMEHLEEKAFPINISEHYLKMFKRYVDDIFVIIKEGKETALLEHLNGLFPENIVFTMEKEQNRRLAFLDALVIRQNGHLRTTVFRKPTNSDRYLNFFSNHPINVRKGIITGMIDRAINLCDDETLVEEINHIRKTLLQNDYPKRFIDDTIKERIRKRKNNDIRRNKGSETRNKTICIPYYPVIGEQIQKIAKNFGYTIAFKSLKDLRSILRSDKVKIPTDRRPGVVYAIKCGCGARYFGETGHTGLHKLKEHQMALTRYKNAEKRLRGETAISRGRPQERDPATIMKEAVNTSAWVEHSVDCPLAENRFSFSILNREDNFRIRKIKEAFFIRHNECINRDEGTEISNIWSIVAIHTGCALQETSTRSETTSI